MAKKFYGYLILDTNEKGVTATWTECEKKVKGKNARFKGFPSDDLAWEWINEGAEYISNKELKRKVEKKMDRDAVYFDAGTGRGWGVEVRIADADKNSLLSKIMDDKKINQYGNYFVGPNRTNNFGELTGLYLALKYAKKFDVKKIYGDSQLVIDYWSKRRYNAYKLDNDTINLIETVAVMRRDFEAEGGKIARIDGDYNPADLGFHIPK